MCLANVHNISSLFLNEECLRVVRCGCTVLHCHGVSIMCGDISLNLSGVVDLDGVAVETFGKVVGDDAANEK